MKYEFLQYVKIITYKIIKQDNEESTVKLCKSPLSRQAKWMKVLN